MSEFNFKGDLENISQQQLEFINKVILENGYKNSKVLFEPVGKAGDNFVANVKRLAINGDHGQLKLIAKIAPALTTIRQTMNTSVLFRNEHIMYTEVLPKLVQLQKNAGLPVDEQLRYAWCYGSFSEEPNEVIILEDLQLSDFKMQDKFTPLPHEYVVPVLKNFATLHSLSYVLKNKDPKTFNKFKGDLTDIWSVMDGVKYVQDQFQRLEDDTIILLDDERYTKVLKDKLANLLKLSTKFVKYDMNNKYSVIQQGDCWTNNFMFRVGDHDLIDSVMIDYQTSKNTSPVCDLLYMIFNCTDHPTRKMYFNSWIDYYYYELERSLSHFHLRASEVYPRNILDDDLKQYGPYMFGLSMILASMLIRKTDDAAKMMDVMKSENMIEEAEELLVSFLDEDSKTRYKTRIIGLIESFIEFRLL